LDDLANLLVRVRAETGNFFKGMNGVLAKTGDVAAGFVKFGAAAGAAIGGLAVAAGKFAADFQDGMADVSTLIQEDAAGAMARFGDDIKRISVQTGKMPTELAGGLYEVISAFGDTADAAQQLGIATKASIGGKADMVPTVKLLSAVTKGYGDTSLAAVRKVADLAFVTTNLGQTTFPELADSMGDVVPLAATLKVKQEALFGSFAALTGVTGNTAEVSTQMKNVMQSLIKPTAQMQSTMRRLGFSSGTAMIESLGLQGALDALAKSTGGNTSQLAAMFSSTEALNAVLALTGNQAADFTTKTEAMAKASGAADEAFRKKTQTVTALWNQLKALGSVALINVGEVLLPPLQTLLQWVVDNMPTIQTVMQTTFGALGQLLQPVGAAFNWLLDNVVTPFMNGWNGSLLALLSPVGIFGLKVREVWDAIAGYFANWRTNIWNPFVQGWSTGNTSMGDVLSTTWATIGSIMRSIWDIIKGVWELAVMWWQSSGDTILAVTRVLWETVLGVVDGALKIVSGVIGFFVSLFKGDWEGMKTAVLKVWSGLWEVVNTILTGAWDLLMINLQAIGSGIVALWGWIKDEGVALWQGLWSDIIDGVVGAYTTVCDWISNLVGDVRDFFLGLVGDGESWGADMIRGFIRGIASMVQTAINKAKEFAGDIADGVKDVLGIHSPSRVFAGIGADVGRGFALGIESTGSLIDRAMAGVTDGTVNTAVRSVSPAGAVAPTGPAGGGLRQPIVIQVGNQTLAEIIVDTLTGAVTPVANAYGR
jgi:TP901 family phage tail tape measure protein